MIDFERTKFCNLKLLFIGSLFLIGLTACQKISAVTIQTPTARIPVFVELAITPSEKAKGLMFRKSLPQGQGMLFVYDQPLIPPFWMKNTLIPLDILFIGSDFKIKHIATDVPPCLNGDPCPSVAPFEKVQYVLELNGGESARKKIAVGDSVELAKDLEKN